MTKTIYEIDKDGFMTYQTLEIEPIGEEYGIPVYELPENYVPVDLPSDEKGHQLPFWKPQWTGEEWIEARPQAEIDKEKNKPIPPSPIDVLAQDVESVAETVSMVMIDSELAKEDFVVLAETLAMLMMELEDVRTTMPIPGEV